MPMFFLDKRAQVICDELKKESVRQREESLFMIIYHSVLLLLTGSMRLPSIFRWMYRWN